MLRRLLVLAVVACAVLGLRSAAYESAVVAETEACCPCDDEDGATDGCCSSAHCACFPAAALATVERDSSADADPASGAPTAWTLGAEQRARDRSTAPPTRPPIG